MMRYLRGMVLLGFVALAGACNTEPDSVVGGTPTKFLIDPGVVFIDQGDSAAVSVQLVDQQGTAINAPITILNVGTGITVAADSSYRPIYDSAGNLVFNRFGTELRLFVTAVSLVSTTFDVSAEGITQSVRVTVKPTELDASVSPSPSDVAELLTITAPSGLTFNADATVLTTAGDVAGYVQSVAADGTSLTLLPIAGLTGFQVVSVSPSYAPSLNLTLESTTPAAVTTNTGAGLPGTGDAATAPELFVRAGVIGGVVDAFNPTVDFSGIGADPGQWYKLVVPADADYTFRLSAETEKDMAIILADADGSNAGYLADSHGNGPGYEEEGTVSLTAGTYLIGVAFFDYGAQATPAWIDLSVVIE